MSRRWLLSVVVLFIVILVVAASLRSSFGVAVESEEGSSPAKACEAVLHTQAQEESVTAEMAPNGSAAWVPDWGVIFSNEGGISAPSMATDRDGHLWVTFADAGESAHPHAIRAYESTDTGNTWSEMGSFQLGEDDYVYNTAVAIDPYDNKVYIVYLAGSEIRCGIYTPGAGWSWNQAIGNGGDSRTQLSMTCEYQYGSANNLYVSYQEVTSDNSGTSSSDLVLAKSTNHGASWTTTKLAGAACDPYDDHSRETSIANAEGRVYLACRHHEPQADYDLWVYVSSDRGATWTQRQVVSNSVGGIGSASIAATHGGNTVVAAYESSPVEVEVPDCDVYYVFSSDGGTTWSAPMGLATSSHYESDPVLAVDGSSSTSNTVYGNIHVVYNDQDLEYLLPYTGIHYSSAAYDALSPAAWSTPESAGGARSSPRASVTTQLRGGKWYPCVAYTLFQKSITTYVMYSTLASSPTVATSAANSVGTTTATLNGALSDRGTAATVQVSFEWGPTTDYGNETPSQSMTSTGDFSATISGLAPGVVYHFRSKAVGDDTSYGDDLTFTTAAGSYDIAGRVTLSGAGLEGVAVTLSGAASASATTDASGNYAFTGLANGSYMVTPGASGYTFSPASSALTVSGADITGVNFTATAVPLASYGISGAITLSGGAGLQGVTVSLSGAASTSTTTDASGHYTFTGLVNGSYTVTPTMSGYTFSPSSSAQVVNGADTTGVTFVATAVVEGAPAAVTTADADNIKADSARLHGGLSSPGTAARVTLSFVWGTDSGSYPNETANVAQSTAGTFYYDLSGLSPGTTYYYKAKAAGDGVSFGAEESFTTAGGSPTIGSLVANNGRPGDELTITITGSDLSGATVVDFGAKIAVSELRVLSDTEITVRIAIDKGAEPGKRDVSVTTPQGVVTAPGIFVVNDGGPTVHLWVYLLAGVGGIVALGIVASVGLLLKRRLAR